MAHPALREDVVTAPDIILLACFVGLLLCATIIVAGCAIYVVALIVQGMAWLAVRSYEMLCEMDM